MAVEVVVDVVVVLEFSCKCMCYVKVVAVEVVALGCSLYCKGHHTARNP